MTTRSHDQAEPLPHSRHRHWGPRPASTTHAVVAIRRGHTGAPAEALEQRAEALGRHWAAALTGEHMPPARAAGAVGREFRRPAWGAHSVSRALSDLAFT
jgi:hypothetical protein